MSSTPPSSVSSGLRKLAKAAALVDFRFHDLRHAALTRWVLYKRKLVILEIMKIGGHRSLEMLLRYANFRPEDMVDRME